MATTEQLALLRATVRGDFDRIGEMSHALRESGGLDEYGEVIGVAFLLAIRLRFPQRYSPADVIRLVADTRVLLDKTGDVIDPRAAELVVRAALGEEELAADLPDRLVVQTQVAVVSVLAHSGKLGDPEAFMSKVQKILDRWAEQTAPEEPAR